MMLKKMVIGGLTFLYLIIKPCGAAAMKQSPTEFNWHATESAPDHYPMEIRQGAFYYKGEGNGSLYIPSGGTLNNGWGNMNSWHVTGADKKPLPDRVDVIFYSYTEKQFYHGKFDLPYDKILDLFRKGYEENPESPRYDAVMIGVAPGGAVSVWVEGFRTTEVFFGQAERINISPSKGFNLTFDTVEESDEYVSDVLKDVLNAEELVSLKKNGVPFGTWARYRKLYKWEPKYKDGFDPIKEEIPVHFLNGEKYFIPKNFNEAMANTPRPIPRTFGFAAPTASGRKLVFEVTFDDFEMMDAFERLSSNGEKVTIEIEPRAPQHASLIRLYNSKESIQLKKVRIE